MAELTPDDLARMARQIEEHVEGVREKLADWSAHMAARFNGYVYLMGSTLHNPRPRDIDIRIVVGDADFTARYWQHAADFKKCPAQRWIDDVAKLGAGASRTALENVDLKVWPESHWHDGVYPTPIVLAAPSPRWFIYNKHVADPAHPRPPATEPATSLGDPLE